MGLAGWGLGVGGGGGAQYMFFPSKTYANTAAGMLPVKDELSNRGSLSPFKY